jgi:16S rRNA C1402 N4-methylase RsmH
MNYSFQKTKTEKIWGGWVAENLFQVLRIAVNKEEVESQWLMARKRLREM